MNPLQFTRSLFTLIIVPPLTLAVSILTLISIFFFRAGQKTVQSFPRFWGRVICACCGVRVKVEGLENISQHDNYIFVANHASQFDIFCFQGYFPHDFRWIAKKELFKIPFFGPAMRRAGFISMDRSQGRQALRSLNEAAQRIAAGTSVLIFPEGTRTPDGRLHPFKAGAVLLAIKSGVPVVPVGFNGTYSILPKGKMLPGGGEITIRVGTPMPTNLYQPRDKQKLAQNLHDKVAELLTEHRS